METSRSAAELSAIDQQFAVETVAKMPPAVKTGLEGWAKLAVACHTHSDAFGKRFTGDEVRKLRKTLDVMEKRFAKQHGNGKTFPELGYELGLDNFAVRDLLAGGPTESERTPGPHRKLK